MNSIKTVIGDLHLQPNNLETAKKLFDFIENDQIFQESEHLILLGDVYNTKAIIRSEAQNFLFNYLSNTRYKRISIIVGNHDYENLECQESALSPLQYLPKVNLYSKQEVSFESDSKLTLAFIPYIHSNDRFLELLKINAERLNQCTYIFCHQGFKGFDLGGGILDDSGIDITELPPNLFIVGHYHKPQSIKNISYLGTPYSHSFGESNQKKHILLIDGSSLKYIPTILPQHYQFKYFAEENKFFFNPTGDLRINSLKSDDYISIIVCCKKSEQVRYGRDFFKEQLHIDCENLKLRYDLIDVEQIIRIDESIGIETMLSKYLSLNKKDYLFNKGMEYLKDANL